MSRCYHLTDGKRPRQVQVDLDFKQKSQPDRNEQTLCADDLAVPRASRTRHTPWS